MKRICIIVSEDIRYNYPLVRAIAQKIAKLDIQVDIFTMSLHAKSEIEDCQDFHVIGYSSHNQSLGRIGKLEFLIRGISTIGKYDAYIGVNEVGLILAHYLAKIRFQKPLIAYFPELFTPSNRFTKYANSLLEKVDLLIDVDLSRIAHRLVKYRLPVERFCIRNVASIAEFLDFDNWELSKSKQEGDSKVLWYHGSISPVHGIDSLLDAYYQSEAVTSLQITGPFFDPFYEKYLRYKIDSYDKFVTLNKPIPRQEVLKKAREFADVAVCFYPYRSTYNSQYGLIYASPAKVFDYMALGIPTITSDNPTLIRYVQNEGWGLCVAPEDTKAISGAIDILMNNPVKRREMGQIARNLFLSKFNLESEIQPFLDWLLNKLS